MWKLRLSQEKRFSWIPTKFGFLCCAEWPGEELLCSFSASQGRGGCPALRLHPTTHQIKFHFASSSAKPLWLIHPGAAHSRNRRTSAPQLLSYRCLLNPRADGSPGAPHLGYRASSNQEISRARSLHVSQSWCPGLLLGCIALKINLPFF